MSLALIQTEWDLFEVNHATVQESPSESQAIDNVHVYVLPLDHQFLPDNASVDLFFLTSCFIRLGCANDSVRGIFSGCMEIATAPVFVGPRSGVSSLVCVLSAFDWSISR